MDKTQVELILIKFANRVIDVTNNKENPTLGELIDPVVKQLIDLAGAK